MGVDPRRIALPRLMLLAKLPKLINLEIGHRYTLSNQDALALKARLPNCVLTYTDSKTGKRTILGNFPENGALTPADGPRELLQLADVGQDAVPPGGWQRTPQGFRNVGVDYAVLALPVVVSGDYRFQVEFTELAPLPGGPPKVVSLVLPVATHGFRIHVRFQNRSDYAKAGIGSIGGKDLFDRDRRGTALKAQLITPGKRHLVQATVKVTESQAHIDASIDGRGFLEWKGPVDDLKDRQERTPRLGIGARKNGIVVHSAKLEILNGKASIAKDRILAQLRHAECEKQPFFAAVALLKLLWQALPSSLAGTTSTLSSRANLGSSPQLKRLMRYGCKST